MMDYEEVMAYYNGTSGSGALVSGRGRFQGGDELCRHPSVCEQSGGPCLYFDVQPLAFRRGCVFKERGGGVHRGAQASVLVVLSAQVWSQGVPAGEWREGGTDQYR